MILQKKKILEIVRDIHKLDKIEIAMLKKNDSHFGLSFCNFTIRANVEFQKFRQFIAKIWWLSGVETTNQKFLFVKN